MLSRNRHACIICGLPMSSERFCFHEADRDEGPAYWSDQGVLCSAPCAHAHMRQRQEAGDPMLEPAEDPRESR